MRTRALALSWLATQLLACTAVLGIESDPTILPAKEIPLEAGTEDVATDSGPKQCSGSLYVDITSDFTGPTKVEGTAHHFGLYDYFRKLNETGGIRGCHIEMKIVDNAYDVVKTEGIVKDWQSDPNWSKVSTVIVFGTGPATRVAKTIMAEKRLYLPVTYAGSLASPSAVAKDISYPEVNTNFAQAEAVEHKVSDGYPYLYFIGTDYSTAIRLAIQAAWKIAPGRIAMAHDQANVCGYCVDPLAAGKAFVGSLIGMSLGRDIIIPQTSSLTPEMESKYTNDIVLPYFEDEIAQTAKDSTYVPVTWVWSGNTTVGSALLGKAIAAAQAKIDTDSRVSAALRAKWRLKIIVNNWGIDETTPGRCGDACKDIFYGVFPVPLYGDLQNSAGMADLLALHDEFAAKDTAPDPPHPARTQTDFRTVRYVQGYAMGRLWQRAVEAAIDAGHPNPSGDDLKAVLDKFQNVDLDGLTSGPISFSETDHRPQSTIQIYKLDGNNQFSWVNKYSIVRPADWLGY